MDIEGEVLPSQFRGMQQAHPRRLSVLLIDSKCPGFLFATVEKTSSGYRLPSVGLNGICDVHEEATRILREDYGHTEVTLLSTMTKGTEIVCVYSADSSQVITDIDTVLLQNMAKLIGASGATTFLDVADRRSAKIHQLLKLYLQ